MPLPSFTVTGSVFDILGNTAGNELVENGFGAGTSAQVTFTPNIPVNSFVTWDGSLERVRPVTATVNSAGEILRNGETVRLLANDPGLNVSGLQWRVDIGPMRTFWFNAPLDGATVDLVTVVPVPGVAAVGIIQGPPGEGLQIDGRVPTYAALPSSAADGEIWLVEADDKLYMRYGGAWPADGAGIPLKGDMLASVYDPTDVADDAFDMANMVEAANAKIMTAAERTKLAGAEVTANKNQPNGYAGLDGTGKVAAAQLPAFVDEILEFANLAAFPATGSAAVIYVALDTGKIYRWSGSAYVEISPSPGSTDAVPEGATNLYFTNARVGSAINAAAAKTTPVDADAFALIDSAAGNALKKTTWANIKTTIKAYYDSVVATPTNKTIDLGNNTLTGTRAQFNTALSDADFYTTGGTDVALADGGTGASLTAPGADRIPFWDQSAGTITWLQLGSNLSITDTTLNASGSGGTTVIASTKTIADYVGPNSPNPGFPALNTAGGDWTDAINLMAADTHGNASGVGGDIGFVVLPAGKGVWNGTALGQLNVRVVGQGPWHTMLTCNTPFINVTGGTGRFHAQGFAVFGGTNPITIGTATDNGGRYRVFTDIEGHGYSGTFIRITGSDTPYFHFARITGDGAANSTFISLAGFTDNIVFHHMEARSYKVALRLPGVMQRMKVDGFNFMHVSETSAAPRYDIVVNPSPNANGLASGIGTTFKAIWHGSEGRDASDRFVVVADDNGSGLPNLAVDSTGYFHGVCFEDIGAFYVADGVPYVYACIDATHVHCNNIGDKARRYVPFALTTSPMFQTRSGATIDETNTIHQWMDLFTKPSTPSALAPAYWDGNKNLSANNLFKAFATTATAAGTTTLTVASPPIQIFTGTTTQTVRLPTTNVPQGAQYTVFNQSTGVVTVQSSGANTISTLTAGATATFIALVATPTTAANWLAVNFATLAGTEALDNKTLNNPTIKNYTETVHNLGTVTTSATVNLTNGTIQRMLLTAGSACAVTMPTAVAGKSFVMAVQQAATPTGTVTFTGAKWPGNTAPTQTAVANRVDYYTFVSHDGTNWYGSAAQNYTP